MPFCPKCGSQLPDGAKFCGSCGAQFAQQEAPQAQSEAPQPVYEEAPQPVYEEAPRPAYEEAPQKVKKPFNKKIFLFGGIAVAVIALVVILIVALSGGKTVNDEGPKWTKFQVDDEIYVIDQNGKNLTKVIDSDDAPYSSVRVSKDEKRIFFGDKSEDGVYNLYVRDVGDEDDVDEPILKGIAGYVLTGDPDWIFFVKGDSAYACNINDPEERVKLGSASVYRNYVSNEDETVYLYLDEGKICRYVVGDSEKTKIASDAEPAAFKEDLSALFYAKNDSDLYYWELGDEEGTKVASEISKFRSSDDLKTCVYVKNEALYSWSVGDEEGTKIASGVTALNRFFGEEKTVFFEKEETLYAAKLGEDPVKICKDVYDVDYTEGAKAYVYQRNDDEGYDLLYYNGKETVTLKKKLNLVDTESVSFRAEDEDAEYSAFVLTVSNDGEKEYYYLFDGELTAFAKGYDLVEDFAIASDKKTVFFIGRKEADDERALFTASVSGSKVDGIEKYADEVSFFSLLKDQPRYYQDTTLYYGKEKVAEDVNATNFTDWKTATFYYVTDRSDSGEGTVYYFDGSKSTKVDSDVNWDSLEQMDNGNLFYLKDVSESGRGELWFYDGSPEKIKEDVTGFDTLS